MKVNRTSAVKESDECKREIKDSHDSFEYGRVESISKCQCGENIQKSEGKKVDCADVMKVFGSIHRRGFYYFSVYHKEGYGSKKSYGSVKKIAFHILLTKFIIYYKMY